MIGITCFGKEHQKRVSGIIEKLTPEIYMLLMEARNYAAKSIGDRLAGNALPEVAFIDKVDATMGRKRLPSENGGIEMIWID